MALTRKMLKAMGIEDEKIDQIIEAHTETTEALKQQRDGFKADAEKLAGVQKQLDELREAGDDGYEEKYNAEHKAFEEYKAEVERDKANAVKGGMYRELLKQSGIDEKRIETIMRVTDLDKVELDGDKLKDAEKLAETIKTEWADFVTVQGTNGAKVDDPPAGTGGEEKSEYEDMTMEEYIAARSKK